MRRKQRHRAFLALLVLRERGPVVLVISLLLAFAAWRIVGHWDRRLSHCLHAYERASTAADTARVDMAPTSAGGRSTCHDLRRNGTLDRHRQAMERERDVAGSDPLIQK